MPKVKLSHSDNLEIVSLYHQGWKISAIVRLLSKTRGIDVNWSTVKNVVKKYQKGRLFCQTEEQSLTNFRKVTSSDVNTVKDALASNSTLTSSDLLHHLTVHRVIKEAGYTASAPRYCQMIRDVNKEKRIAFCQKLIDDNEHFDDIIFTDECTIQLPKHALKIHVWGGISRRGTTQLLLFEGILKADFFVESILKKTLLPFIKTVYPDKHRFQQDNDPKHRSILAKTFIAENEINWWDIWPSESQDLNPIEMVWNMLKCRLAKQDIRTKDQLVSAIHSFWNIELTVELCNTFIDLNFKVVPIVVRIGGRATAGLPRKIFPERSRGKSIAYFASKMKDEDVSIKVKNFVPSYLEPEAK